MRTAKYFQSLLGKGRNITTARFEVRGMTCNHCAERVHKAVETLPGIASTEIDLKSGGATVIYHPETVSAEQILEQIVGAGYSATLQNQPP